MMIHKYKKTQGWEQRLNDLIMRYYALPFQRGENCCFLYISDGYEALCGTSPIAEWRGKFKTKKKALALYRKNAGMDSFEKTFQWLSPVKSYKYAQRGDMGIWIDENGMEVLGIVAMNGRNFLIRCEDRDGLVSIKLNDKVRLWRAE